MTETVKVNLTKAFMSLKIMSTVAGALIACFVVYMNIDSRMDKMEGRQGIMDERTATMSKRVDEIYYIVIEWEPRYATQSQ